VFLHQDRTGNSNRTIDISDGEESVVLAEEGAKSVDMACWSPDGNYLAILRRDWQIGADGKKHMTPDSANERLEIVSLDGKYRRELKLEGADVMSMCHPDWK
jgi:hypothetical protein